MSDDEKQLSRNGEDFNSEGSYETADDNGSKDIESDSPDELDEQPNPERTLSKIEEHLDAISKHLRSTNSEIKDKGKSKQTFGDGVTLQFDNICYSTKVSGERNWYGRKISEDTTKTILSHVSGECKPGELVAIMGPSGAGKTTLLDILARRIQIGITIYMLRYILTTATTEEMKDDENIILVNGKVRDSTFGYKTAYVKQEDLLMGSATVKETLQYSAKLRLPGSMSQQQKEEKVEQLLKDFDLLHVANSRIGTANARGISGGEQKRVSIGVEVITDPRLIFLDEPTSGLDATMALTVISSLRKLATEKNRTVICTIHQPRYEIFQLFDKLLLLAKGRVAYFGPAQEATTYFENLGWKCHKFDNPADYFLDILQDSIEENPERPSFAKSLTKLFSSRSLPVTKRSSRSIQNVAEELEELHGSAVRVTTQTVEHLLDQYQESPEAVKLHEQLKESRLMSATLTTNDNEATVRESRYNSSIWTQLSVLTLRNLRNSVRDPMLFHFQILQYVFAALLTALIYVQIDHDQRAILDRQSVVFWNCMYVTIVSAFTYITVFPRYRNLFNRETASHSYGSLPFTISLSVYQIPSQIISVVLYSLVIYYVTGLNSDFDRFVVFVLLNFLGVQVSESLAIMVSAVSPTQDEANLLMTVVIYFWFSFLPIFVTEESIPRWLLWIPYSSFYKWLLEAMLVNEFKGQSFQCDSIPCPIAAETVMVGNVSIPIDQFPLDDCVLPCPFPTGDAYLKFLGITFDSSVWEGCVILVALYCFFKILTYLSLRYFRAGKS